MAARPLSPTPEEKLLITRYYRVFGLEATFPKNAAAGLKALATGDSSTICVTADRKVRALAKALGRKRVALAVALAKATRFEAIAAALQVAAEHKVPCFFINRVGKKKDGFAYAPDAVERMEQHLNFPTLAENSQQYEHHLKRLFGDKYSPQYIDDLKAIPQVIFKGGKYVHEDAASPLVNTMFGKRVTIGQPEEYVKTIHVYGRCGAFGYAVEDGQTLPSQLQKWLNDHASQAIRVVNHGIWGGDNDCILQNFVQEVGSYGPDDIVLFYMKHFDMAEMAYFGRLGLRFYDITDEWHSFEEAVWCFYDKPGHMIAQGYARVAELVGVRLMDADFKAGSVDEQAKLADTQQAISRFLSQTSTGTFFQDLEQYLDKVEAALPPASAGQARGAIVMNCNPFTKGHRYLIEYAAARVDQLIVFVVQEDRSVFKFEDRLAMVREGTSDLPTVFVLPSGQFMISAMTFPEYFLKDYVQEKDFDVSGDLEVFSQWICPRLGISVRFAGEEPTDVVTAHYNESMAKILPEHGIAFCEVPRLRQESGDVVSATEVRRLMAEGDMAALDVLLPSTTIKIIEEHYV